ncbi:hypothetical protein Shyhy01_24600 [Streptomyces hygroscopicus subsp. hygroscopicus]|nr:hypothetical protein Shyhy01_24600 [Streptomyces hygroscopicus subsp. hygroscopicus]
MAAAGSCAHRPPTATGVHPKAGRTHCSCLRFPRDLPTAGKSVVVPFLVRGFVCEEETRE